MKTQLIEGVEIKELKVHADERGFLMELLRNDDKIFDKFGQVYMTTCYPGVIKAWHFHKKQIDHFVVVKGMAKVVLYDTREGSSTIGTLNEFFLGEKHPILLKIPNQVQHGFKAVGDETCYLLNISTEPYDCAEPDEFRLPYDTDEIPYDWSLKHG